MNNIDRKTLDQAREWAEHAKTLDEISVWPTALAAAEVIQSLPDEIIDGDKVREIIETYEHARDGNAKGSEGWMINHLMVSNLESLLTPPPRTLADMDAEERYECLLMQCETWANELAFLVDTDGPEGTAQVLSPKHGLLSRRLEDVIPRPDLPKLEWPGSEPEEAEDAATEPAPLRPEDVPVGEAWQMEVEGKEAIGYRNAPEEKLCWAAVYRDTAEHDWLYDSDVTLVARLVPKTTEQADEQDFDPAYTYRDHDGDEWEYIEGRWVTDDTHAKRVAAREYRRGRASLPVRYGPYTRIEKEEDNE